MKQIGLPVHLTACEQREMAGRYHFGEEALPQIDALYGALLPLVQARAYYDVTWDGKKVFCAVTLGENIDAMQALYGSVEAVLEEYVLDCLGNALLEQAYGLLGEALCRETGLYLNRYEFPGSQLPIERVGEIVRILSAGIDNFPISYNEAYVLLPKKSAVFVGVLEKRKTEISMCQSCPNIHCEGRKEPSGGGAKWPGPALPGKGAKRGENFSYGYQKIFGGDREG